MANLQGGFSMDLTRMEFSVYIGTLKGIIKTIDDNKGLNIKQLRKQLMYEIETFKKTIVEQ